MAYADYIHCVECDTKLIYDGHRNIRDSLQEHYNIPEDNYTQCLICPSCLKKKLEIIDSLMKTNVFLSKRLSEMSESNKHTVSVKPIEYVKHTAEIWVDGKLEKVYTGQDAIDVELGKIKIPKGAVIKSWDI